jgi:hypothetical protein
VIERIDPLTDPVVIRAVSNLQPRSERQPELAVLERTYVDTGVLPQLQNENDQILYGRRGTGKSHVLRVLGSAHDGEQGRRSHIYLDVRLLGSAQLMTDETQPLTFRAVAVFRDLMSEIQNCLLDIATDPNDPTQGAALEAVSLLADALTHVAHQISQREITVESSAHDESGGKLGAKIGTSGVSVEAGLKSTDSADERVRETYREVLRETVVFSEVAKKLDEALAALQLDRFIVLIDEWPAIPADVQPYVAEFIRRTLMTSRNLTVKIASLEYRSNFAVQPEGRNLIGFEVGPDIVANLDLDDYYVYERNPDQVTGSFLDLLYQHLRSELPDGYLEDVMGVHSPASFRARIFTEPATFVELVRAGEGVVRDFLGIFSMAFFRARRGGRPKIDMNSVEEAARDWYETDKSANLAPGQEEVLHRIIGDVIGNRHARSFLLERSQARHPTIQSLFDLRLVHLMRRGYSDKENPGLRYNIYSLDYGTYVDLKRTKSEPELDFVEVDDPGAERVVPFDDKRSIRRIILDPAILDTE